MMWERCRDLVEAKGCKVVMNTRVVGIRTRGRQGRVGDGRGDRRRPHGVPVRPRHLVDADLAAAAGDGSGRRRRRRPRRPRDLRYRDFLTVALVVPEEYSFPDNWIYVHSKEVQVGRIQNFGSWSPYMVKEGRTCLGLEFFVFEGDETWNKPDEELIEQGKRELGILNLVDPAKVEAGYVVRMPKAYPFYDEHYKANVARIVEWLERLRAQRASRSAATACTGTTTRTTRCTPPCSRPRTSRPARSHDVWSVNVEEEYHEEAKKDDADPQRGARGTGRDAPVIPRHHYGDDHPVNKPAPTA